MRGKIVNLCIGFSNILFGVLLLIFTMYIPQDKTLTTVQEATVISNILLGTYAVMVLMVMLDFVQYYNLRRDTIFNTAYLVGMFALSFIFIKEPIIATFSIISGAVIVIRSLKENLVEVDSITAISFTVIIMIACSILSLVSLSYKSLGKNIREYEYIKQKYFAYE